MTLAPQLDAADFVGSAEMVSVAIFAEPASLAGSLAGQTASGLETVALAILGPRVGNEKLGATAAFTSGQRAAHRKPYPRNPRTGRKSKKKTGRKRNPKKEEKIQSEMPEENPSEEDPISNRQLSLIFISPLAKTPQ
jgi:hypothetical protein